MGCIMVEKSEATVSFRVLGSPVTNFIYVPFKYVPLQKHGSPGRAQGLWTTVLLCPFTTSYRGGAVGVP